MEKIRIIYDATSLWPYTASAHGKIVVECSDQAEADRFLKNHVNVLIDPTPEIEREWLEGWRPRR